MSSQPYMAPPREVMVVHGTLIIEKSVEMDRRKEKERKGKKRGKTVQ